MTPPNICNVRLCILGWILLKILKQNCDIGALKILNVVFPPERRPQHDAPRNTTRRAQDATRHATKQHDTHPRNNTPRHAPPPHAPSRHEKTRSNSFLLDQFFFNYPPFRPNLELSLSVDRLWSPFKDVHSSVCEVLTWKNVFSFFQTAIFRNRSQFCF